MFLFSCETLINKKTFVKTPMQSGGKTYKQTFFFVVEYM